MKRQTASVVWSLLGIALIVVAAAVLPRLAPGRQAGALVVYCAHDSVYSESILKQFEKDTGIPVAIRFDTEASKSLGLVEMIKQEAGQEAGGPRCDVFWNNELLGTLDLLDHELLEPYLGSGWRRMPMAMKDPHGCWTGFAARLRVWIVNTRKHEATLEAIAKTMAGPSLSMVTMAKPLYGTTRTHYTVQWSLWGADRLKQWHKEVRARGLVEAQSNGQTKNLVAGGHAAIGWTDTDDYFLALDAGSPVAMVAAEVESGHTICIPNTVAIIKGTPRQKWARKLVDYLLSAQVETALASSKARQVPLGPVDTATIPAEVQALMPAAARGFPLAKLGAARQECLAWLKQEYLE